MADFYAQAAQLFPYLPPDLLRVYAEAWARTGDPTLALAELRAHPRYVEFFPGNRRDDGTVRLTEFDYLSTIEGYNRQVASFNIPPEIVLTPERKRRLIESGSSPDEFGTDVARLAEGVLAQGDLVRSAFARIRGIDPADISDAALVASAIDAVAPDSLTRSPLVLQREITAAQIGGEAARFGFDVTAPQSLRFQTFGLDQSSARELFAQAGRQLPRFNAIAAAVNDPSSSLTLEDFTEALVLRSPEELSTLQRLSARHRASFSSLDLFATDEEGRLSQR